MAYERKFEKVDLSQTELDLSHPHQKADHAWISAFEHVDMGIKVMRAIVEDPTLETKELQDASYTTDTGREGQYFFVMIDRWKNGDYKALTACTDYYLAAPPLDIYKSLRAVMKDVKCKPVSVYNSLSGGQQRLVLSVDDMEGIASTEKAKMQIVLRTSLDRSSNHTISIRPVLADGTPIYFQDTGRNGFDFKIRHTTQAAAEISNFNSAAARIVLSWNNQIVPFVNFLSDGHLTELDTMVMLSKICEDADLPKQTGEEVIAAYKQSPKSALDAVAALCRHNENDESLSPMARQRNADKIAKAINQRVTALMGSTEK